MILSTIFLKTLLTEHPFPRNNLTIGCRRNISLKNCIIFLHTYFSQRKISLNGSLINKIQSSINTKNLIIHYLVFEISTMYIIESKIRKDTLLTLWQKNAFADAILQPRLKTSWTLCIGTTDFNNKTQVHLMVLDICRVRAGRREYEPVTYSSMRILASIWVTFTLK